MAEGQEGN